MFEDKIRFSLNVDIINGEKLLWTWRNKANEKKMGLWGNLTESKISNHHKKLAIICGQKNNILVIDFDEYGMQYFNQFENIMDTYIETSTRGFKHAYFLYDEDLKNHDKNIKNNFDIDILSNGSFCILGDDNNNKEITKIPKELKDFLLCSKHSNDCDLREESEEVKQEIDNDFEYDKINDLCKIIDNINYDNYDTWIKIGLVIKKLLNAIGYDIWNEHSKKSNKYKMNKKGELLKLYNDFKTNNEYTIGTLIYLVSNKRKLSNWFKKYTKDKNDILDKDDTELSDDYLLMQKLFTHAKENEYKRDTDGNVYKKIQSYAYEKFLEPKEYINLVMKGEYLYLKNHNSLKTLITYLTEYEVFDEFQFIKINKDYIGFKNGMLNIITCEFYDIETINNNSNLISIIARKYIDKDFIYSIDTPILDKVLKYQFDNDDNLNFIYACVGRLFGIRDNFQFMMMNFGEANTGKSTLIEIIKLCFNNIGYISSSYETKFGLGNLYDKELILCDDVPQDLKSLLPQNDFLSMVSNGSVSCAIKNQKKAVQVDNFKVPIMFCGNYHVNYLDQGNISRRLMIANYEKVVINTDTSLKNKIIENELPAFIYKSLLQYNNLLKDNGKDIWTICPEIFLDSKQEFRLSQNPFYRFLDLKTEYKEGSSLYIKTIKDKFNEWIKKDIKQLNKGTLTLYDPRYIICSKKLCKSCKAIYSSCSCSEKNKNNRTTSEVVLNIAFIDDEYADLNFSK